jgi:outer membrane protein
VARTRLMVGWFVAALTLVATMAMAQEKSYTVPSYPGGQQRGARLGGGEMQLTLKEAITVALQHNISLEVSRLSLASARFSVVGAAGIFDPLLTSDYTETSDKTPATNQLVGAQVGVQKTRSFDLSLAELLPTGANLSLGWTNRRSETNSTFYFFNPSFSSGLNFSLSQPLLSGFGTDVNRAEIEVARRNRDISRLEFERIVITTVQQVESAYWNLVYVRDDLKVKQESLKLAQDLLDQTRTRVRIGTSAPIDIVQSEATVAAREREIILAENAVADAADVLKQLMGFENPDDWQTSIVPADELGVAPAPVDLGSAIDAAIHKRVELRENQLADEIGEINVVSAHNATRPKLNLNLGYGYSGVGGTLTDPTTGVVLRGGWGDALRQIRNRDYESWSAGVSLSYPLGDHAARAALAERRFALDSARQELALERQTVIAQVRQAVRGLEAGAKSIAAAVKARELAERNLDAEEKKFANGMSTNYQVLQIQSDLTTARAAELQSRVAYRDAIVAYDVAVGSLLDTMNVRLAEGAEPKEPHTFLSKVDWLKYRHWASPLGAPATPGATAAPTPKAN